MNAIVPAAIRLHERSIIDMTHDSVEVANCVPKYGTLRTDAAGLYFDHIDGNTYFWSAAAWELVTIEEATGWGLLVPDKPQPWITIVRHAYAERQRRQLTATDRRLLR